MNPNLVEYIRRYIPISDTEIDLFQSHLEPLKLNKKKFLLKEGQFCTSRYFIVEGCMRLFYIDDKGNEQITHFAIDHWWISDYESLVNRTPTKFFLQAIENTELLELSEDSFNKLCLEMPNTERLFRKIMEKTYIAIQKRMEYMFSLSGAPEIMYFEKLNL